MKTIALVLVIGLNGAVSAAYKEAEGAMKNLDFNQAQVLDGLLAQPGPALAKDARAAALLADNQAALELFRQAAEEPSDGYLLAPKPARLSAKTPVPALAAHFKLLRLLLIEAKAKAAQKQTGPAEKDLLAAAGFLLQFSAQKANVILGSVYQQFCLLKAAPVISDSLRGTSAGPAYLKELAARLDKAAKNQDFMQAAMAEGAETSKGTMLEEINPETMAAERAKMPFLTRLGAKKLQDQEFFSKVYSDYNAAVDARFKVLTAAFRANDPVPAGVFIDKQRQEILARKQARDKRGTLSGVMDGLKGGPQAKKEMAEMIVDRMISATASYEKLVPRHHLFLCQLNVLRSALAVKLYQRAKKRLPDSLDQLVPAYLPAVPQDSFNKFAPLVYVKTGKKFLVYSFGPDGKDNGAPPRWIMRLILMTRPATRAISYSRIN